MKTTINYAEAMGQIAWERRERRSNPWLRKDVQAFKRDMDRAGYVFEEHEYPIGSGSLINSRWEQLWAWCESIAQNERDTAKGL
jgi:hypothetical protein